jgi:molecular chaperone DnaK
MSDSSEPTIGIDLGTTNSAVATFDGTTTKIIERATGQRLMPSMVGITSSGERVVGEEARLLAETMPQSVAYATKRLIGMRWTPEVATRLAGLPYPILAGPQKDIRVRLSGKVLSVTEVAAAVLSELRTDAEAYFDRDVRRAVITVPANFNDAQRQATREAASIAGLDVLRLINEPTAAALAFGQSTSFFGHVVVFDLGGGTFDVSILECREDGTFAVVATGGDPTMGGEDFDNMLVEWLLSHLTDPGARHRVEADHQALARLKVAAEQAKKAVSVTEEAHVHLVLVPERAGKSIVIDTLLTRQFFEKLVKPKTEHCLQIVERTMGEAKLKKEQVAAVLLIGGMTRVPLLRRMVRERIGELPPQPVDPDEAVALGAAIHAAQVAQAEPRTRLLDVVGSTLGVGITGGLMQPVIAKNTRLPASVKKVFNPGYHGRELVRIPIVQGEGRHVFENWLLGELTLGHLQTIDRARTEIEVRFDMGVDGILTVTVHDDETGQTKVARVVGRTDISEEERQKLITEESKRRTEKVSVDKTEREKNRLARRALHDLMVPLRRLHRDAKLSATGDDAEGSVALAERLGRKIVAAELIESKGTRDEVLEVAKQIRELLIELGAIEH